MLVPTRALVEEAQRAGEEWLLEPDVWTDAEHDRTGREHSLNEMECAAWTVFLAKLVSEGPETEAHRNFRKKCLQLGFSGCWSVYVARAGGSIEELLAEADKVSNLTELAKKSD